LHLQTVRHPTHGVVEIPQVIRECRKRFALSCVVLRFHRNGFGFIISIGLKALYCDVRQLLAYIKDVHGGIFRRVLLSGLLDSAARPQQPQDTPPENSGYFK